MPYYILTINYPELFESSNDRVRFPKLELDDEFEPVDLFPWLDPIWGIIRSRIDAVDAHYPAVSAAEIVI
ncbi:MAG: hypothetical protein H6751_14880 [Candidatus Omnitrophica bacterium]|nr:hypothetical protein [Candidatus Omnitrophota bacterium]MCB9784246.1 hypothetical protein [Candidatus Omnitrophota bacterium]